MLKLKELYEENDNKFPDNGDIFQALQTISELNPYIKKIMPFVQMLKDSFNDNMTAALDITLPFDEKTVLLAHKEYLVSTLEVNL